MLFELFLVWLSIPFYLLFLFKWVRKKYSYKMIIIKTFLFIAIIVFIAEKVFPIPIDDEVIALFNMEEYRILNNFIPFKTIIEMVNAYQLDNFVYILLFLYYEIRTLFVVGFILPFVLNKECTILEITKKLLILIASLEAVKTVITFTIKANYKGYDIDIILLNFLGGVLGYLTYNFIIKIIRNKLKLKKVVTYN